MLWQLRLRTPLDHCFGEGSRYVALLDNFEKTTIKLRVEWCFKAFSSQGKSGNFEQTGKVREFTQMLFIMF